MAQPPLHSTNFGLAYFFLIHSHLLFHSNTSAMQGFLTLLLVQLANAKIFKVFHNTFDPAVFGTKGGAHHNGTGEGNVDALTVCNRFQVQCSLFEIIQAENVSIDLWRSIVSIVLIRVDP